MRVVIDRFEEDMAVLELEDLSLVSAPRLLFENAHEGDLVEILVIGGETDKRKTEIDSLFSRLKKKKT